MVWIKHLPNLLAEQDRCNPHSTYRAMMTCES